MPRQKRPEIAEESDMQTIVVEPQVFEDLKREAKIQARDVNEIANETLEKYLRGRRRAKLHDEIQAYIKMHPRLKKKYLGEWVAIHEHKLIDHDTDYAALYQRVQQKYKRSAVLIRQVEKGADPIYVIRSPVA